MGRLLVLLFFVFNIFLLQAQDKQKEKDSVKSFQIIPFPNISNNQVFGWGGGINVAMLYPLNKKDTVSPVTTTVIQPMYFQNDSWWVALYSEMYFAQDKWRSVFLGFKSNVNFQFYTKDYLPDYPDKIVSYTGNVTTASISLMRKIFPKFYFGMQYIYGRSEVSFPDNEIIERLLKKFSYTENTESGLGFTLNYDTRNDIYSPDKGMYLIANNYFYRDALGSTVDYDFIMTEFSYYKRLSSKLVWASKLGIQATLGDVPFIDENVQGFGGMRAMDLRGYNKGEYRGEQMYNAQTEFRYNIYNRYSVNGYLGAGTVFNPGDQKPFLPAAGLGLRYLASTKYKVKVGIDYAWGKDDHGIYFLIGEAF